MKLVFGWLNWLFDFLYRVALIIAQVTLVSMVLIIGINVFMRYVLNSGLKWGEEISLILIIWFSFIAMALGVRKNLHISIHLLRNPPPVLDKILNILKSLVTIFVGVVMFWYGNIIIDFMSRSILPATQLPSWVFYAVLPLSSILIIYEGITDLFGFDTTRNDSNDTEETENA